MNSQKGNALADIMGVFETEKIVEELKEINVKNYGSLDWIKQHHHVSKLNQQSHINMLSRGDEYVMDSLVVLDQQKTLIHEILVCEVWKQHVLPLIKDDVRKSNSIKSYICLFQEGVLANLQESCLYHKTACDGAEYALQELMDYCYRKVYYLINNLMDYSGEEEREYQAKLERTIDEEFRHHERTINFGICMSCISIIRYVTDHLTKLPPAFAHHIVVQADIVMLLVDLIDQKPWLKKTKDGKREIWEDAKWQIVTEANWGKVPKIEAQCWISVYNILLTQETAKKYEITESRKNSLMKLKKYLNELLIDQIPPLAQLLKNLEYISMQNCAAIQTIDPFMVQQLPELRNRIMENNNWEEIGEFQKENYFNNNKDKREFDMQMELASIYGNDAIDTITEGFKCPNCTKSAVQRCSRCKSEWYCSKQCQVIYLFRNNLD